MALLCRFSSFLSLVPAPKHTTTDNDNTLFSFLLLRLFFLHFIYSNETKTFASATIAVRIRHGAACESRVAMNMYVPGMRPSNQRTFDLHMQSIFDCVFSSSF